MRCWRKKACRSLHARIFLDEGAGCGRSGSPDLIDAALAAGFAPVVMVGSRGGTQSDQPLTSPSIAFSVMRA